jgi:hypothetical protein
MRILVKFQSKTFVELLLFCLSGPECLQNVCDFNPCANGGVCKLIPHGHSCACTQGFGGLNCRQRLDPCEVNPCGRNGLCVRQKNSTLGYKCQCHLWWIGQYFCLLGKCKIYHTDMYSWRGT